MKNGKNKVFNDDFHATIRKKITREKASHPSSTRGPDIDFQKLVGKLKQIKVTKIIEETNFKITIPFQTQTTTLHINNIQE